ncbi:DUF6573 family protein [Streptomyces glomeratus]|uniref:Uncharacterized protein n=1 Tax=Streptomyces glomeratus TaxID=284452 RepID=A0ABP6LL42_9ACTN|nr:DUF6573 family protein [Streptomyces glomeratus]MCF1512334.1 hypothetical protein [Streptomyces glomeratus]
MPDSLIPGASDCDGVSEDAMRWRPEEQHSQADALTELFGGEADVIHAYARAQALADGVLVAAPTELAREAGFRVPVALTAAAWAHCVLWGDEDSRRQTPQDETGRLWDILTMTRSAIRRSQGGAAALRSSCTGFREAAAPVSPAESGLPPRSGPATTPSGS